MMKPLAASSAVLMLLLPTVTAALPSMKRLSIIHLHNNNNTTNRGPSACLTTTTRSNTNFLPLAVRGGGAAVLPAALMRLRSRKQHHDDEVAAAAALLAEKKQRRRQVLLLSTATSALLYVLYRERAFWTPFLNRKYIEMKTLSILEKIKPSDDDNGRELARALLLYGLGMTAWEFCGLNTIPVETAAGMIFDFWPAALASLVGKLLGATLSFAAGRTILASTISNHKAFAENPIFQLLNHTTTDDDDTSVSSQQPQHTHTHPPLLTAFLMKFSFFPELIKNLGSSIIPVIRPWMFVVVTAVHGGAFTLLWTWLGVDTAARMQQATGEVELPPNRALQVTLALALVVAFVLTPLAMAWWIRDLKRGADEQEAAAANNKKKKRRRFFVRRR